MLEAAGLAADGGRWGGVLGTERLIVWYDLDAPVWRTPAPVGPQSSMERYDAEFELRLGVIATALAHNDNPSVELLMSPARIVECDECPWWDYCEGQLRSGSGNVTLLPRVGEAGVEDPPRSRREGPSGPRSAGSADGKSRVGRDRHSGVPALGRRPA